MRSGYCVLKACIEVRWSYLYKSVAHACKAVVAFDFLMVKVDFKNLCWGLCTSEKVHAREDEMST